MTNQNFTPHPDGELHKDLSFSGKILNQKDLEEITLFKDFFGIKAKEENLDFVNIPLNTDLPMYIYLFICVQMVFFVCVFLCIAGIFI